MNPKEPALRAAPGRPVEPTPKVAPKRLITDIMNIFDVSFVLEAVSLTISEFFAFYTYFISVIYKLIVSF